MVEEYDEMVIKQAIDLHYGALSYRSFITLFGHEFLYQLYKGLLSENIGILIAYKSHDMVTGFVLGCTDSRKLIPIILRKIVTFCRIMMPTLVRKPGLIRKVVESSLYSKKSVQEIRAELLAIVVGDEWRSTGVGSLLIEKLDEEFRKREISEYKVSVHEEMGASNRFYLKNGMTLCKSFSLYGVGWNVYSKRIL